MDGFLNILKPPGMTSFDVVSYIRRLFGTRKVGHAGTLDPGASGVLPLACGKATRLIEFLPPGPKFYRAEMILGVATDTQDTFGTTIAREPCGNVTAESLREIFPRFLGKIMQKPPIYSAVHHEGERLYDLARRGVEVAVKPRAVEIHSIDLVDFGSGRALIDVSCGPGTYVRALVNDLGEALGCGATLSFLVRTRSGPFHIDDAVLIEEAAPCALLPIDRPLSHMRAVILDEKMLHPFLHGCRSQSNKFTVDRGSQSPGIYKVYSPVKEFLGLGEIIPGRQMSLVPLKIFPRE